MSANVHEPLECPYCWRVLYSKSAQSNHINHEHWKEVEAEKEEETDEVS